MPSDKQLFEIFSERPDWLYLLLGLTWPGAARFRSVALKAVERTADGVLEPESEEEDLWVVEFQMARDRLIYARVAIQMALLQIEHAGRTVRGAVVFGQPRLDPRTPPFDAVVVSVDLPALYGQLSDERPHHPLVSLLRPITTADADAVIASAPEDYNRITSDPSLTPEGRNRLGTVFITWLAQILPEITMEALQQTFDGRPDASSDDAERGMALIKALIARQERGKAEGKAEGWQKAEKAFEVRAICERLGEPVPAMDELREIDDAELDDRLQTLRRRVGK